MDDKELLKHGVWSNASNHPEHYPAPMNDPRVLLTVKIPKTPETIEATKLEDKRWLIENAPTGSHFTIFWPGEKKSTSRFFSTKLVRQRWLDYIDEKYYKTKK